MSSIANYTRLHEKDYISLYEKYEASQKELKELRLDNKDLKAMNSTLLEIKSTLLDLKKINSEQKNEIEKLTESLNKTLEENKKLREEIQRLKNNNKKDSSNSSNFSKPSSTNGSKIIPNTRTKSGKKPGGQFFHAAHNLKSKDVEVILKDENFKERIKHTKEMLNANGKKAPKFILDLLCQIVVNENVCNDFDKLNDVQYVLTADLFKTKTITLYQIN